MCGFCGSVGWTPDTTRLRAGLAALAHRGPDAEGVWQDGRVMLGHRRLSIIDLSDAGRQPLANETGTVQVILNGEIYNFADLRRQLEGAHSFRSHSDTEVLAHGFEEWGIEGLLRRISGMYAFAIWDTDRSTLHLARDRIGKKPLFYAEDAGSLAFASSLPSLLELLPFQPEPRAEAIQDFLLHLCVPGTESIMQGIRKLPPGHRAEFRDGRLRIERYWSVSFAEQEERTEEEWLELIDAEVRRAVKARLVSDVPIGVFLSGGVDSSLIAAMTAEYATGPVTTISAGFTEERYSELPHARAVAAHIGADHHEHIIRPDHAAVLPWMVFTAGEPFGDQAVLPTLYLSRAAREHATVVLTGDGGDECFAGYPTALAARVAGAYARWVPEGLRAEHIPALLERMERGGGRLGRRARQLRRMAEPARGSEGLTWEFDALGERSFRGMWPELFTDDFSARLTRHDPDAYWRTVWAAADGPTDTDRLLFTDLTALLPDLLLVKADVATMAYGLEARSPLLDTGVIELSARIPAAAKLRGLETKRLLKLLAARYVPHEVIYRRKQGFSLPLGEWMRGGLGRLVEEVLLSGAAASRGIFRPTIVRELIEAHRSGRVDHGHRLWLLFTLELWMLMFVDRSLTPTDTLTIPSARPVAVR